MLSDDDIIQIVVGSIFFSLIFFTPIYFIEEHEHKKTVETCKTQTTYVSFDGYVKSCAGVR